MPDEALALTNPKVPTGPYGLAEATKLVNDAMPPKPTLHELVAKQISASPSEALRVRIRRAWASATSAVDELKAVGLSFGLAVVDGGENVVEFPKHIQTGIGSTDFVVVYNKDEELAELEKLGMQKEPE